MSFHYIRNIVPRTRRAISQEPHEPREPQRRRHPPQRRISRTEAVFDGVERFTKRTISVCLSQHEDDSDLPTAAEVEALLSDDIDEDEEEAKSDTGDVDRDGEHTIS